MSDRLPGPAGPQAGGGSSGASAGVRGPGAGLVPEQVAPASGDVASRSGLPVGKGITDTVIRVGLVWADTKAYNAAGRALGGEPTFYEPQDPKGVQNAVVEHINANGGIAGRKVEPVWHEILASNAVTKEGRARDAQEACATYTEDNQVFAIMGSGQWTEDNILECAIRTQTPYIDGSYATGLWVSEERFAQASEYYYMLSGLLTDRRERAMVESLSRQRLFTKGAKIGLVVEDSPSIRQGVDRGLKPGLAKLGAEVVSEVRYPDIIESPWQNYVLEFQTAGVTHVIFSASTAESWPTLLFMRAAENQRYRPQYGISGLPANWLRNNAPPEQLQHARGVTWLAGGLSQEPPPPVSPNDQVCRDIMRTHGHPERVGVYFCDFLFFLKHSLDRAGALTPAGLAASTAAIGAEWTSVLTHDGATRYGPQRHDGVELVRDFAWDGAKGEWRDTGETYPAP